MYQPDCNSACNATRYGTLHPCNRTACEAFNLTCDWVFGRNNTERSHNPKVVECLQSVPYQVPRSVGTRHSQPLLVLVPLKVSTVCCQSIGIIAAHPRTQEVRRWGYKTDSNAFPYEDTWDSSQWAPVVDGVELVDDPPALIESGRALTNITLVVGSNADEGTEFIAWTRNMTVGMRQNISTSDLQGWLDRNFLEQVCRGTSRAHDVDARHL